MKLVILDAATFGDVSLSPLFEGMDSAFHAEIFPSTTPAETAPRLANAEVAISNKVRIGFEEMDAAPSLRLIHVAATGTNNVDLEEARRRGIAVTNVPGYATASAAAHTLALYFHLAHQLAYHDRFVKSGAYSQSPIFTHLDAPFRDPIGLRWGLIGMGTMGQATASHAAALGFEVVYHSTSGANLCQPWPHLALDELLATSQVISIHASLTERTRGLLDRKKLALLQPETILINVARGGILNEIDLATALRDGLPLRVALDVFESEPLPHDHPLLMLGEHPRLVFTPHIAGLSIQARTRLIREVAENQRAYERGSRRNRVI